MPLAAAAHGAIARQRARARAEARAERGRNVLQRAAATAAGFLGTPFDSQPMAAGDAFRVQALHSPAGQILHRASWFGKFQMEAASDPGKQPSRSSRPPTWQGFCVGRAWCVKRECTPLVGVRVRRAAGGGLLLRRGRGRFCFGQGVQLGL